MTYQIELNEAKIRLLDLIEAAFKGEDVFILKDSDQMVQLVPVKSPRRKAKFGSAKGKIQIADDFDEPLEEFREYMP